MSNNVVVAVPKDQVHFEGDFALIDTGMPKEELALAMLQYIASEKDTVAVVKKGDE